MTLGRWKRNFFGRTASKQAMRPKTCRFIAVLALLSGSSVAVAQPTTRPADWQAQQVAWLKATNTAVADPVSGWTIALHVQGIPGPVVSFDAHDRIHVGITVADLRRGKVPAPWPETAPRPTLIVTKVAAPGPQRKPAMRVELTPHGGWGDGASDGTEHAYPYLLGVPCDLRAAIPSLDDGEYDLVAQWPALGEMPALTSPSVRIRTGHATLADARAAQAAEPIAPGDDLVTLEIEDDAKLGSLSPMIARLTNHNDQPIAFRGQLRGPRERSDTPYEACNGRDVYKPGGWRNDVILGYCGTGTGPIDVAPGGSVRVALTGLSPGAISRGRLMWWFSNHQGPQPLEYHQAVSQPIQRPLPTTQGAG